MYDVMPTQAQYEDDMHAESAKLAMVEDVMAEHFDFVYTEMDDDGLIWLTINGKEERRYPDVAGLIDWLSDAHGIEI